MDSPSVASNHYTALGLELGASVAAVRDAAADLRATTTDQRRLDEIDDAEYWLTSPSLRSYHDAQIRWAAAGEWWGRRHPEGTSVDRHSFWAEYRRQVIEDDPTLWERVRKLFRDSAA